MPVLTEPGRLIAGRYRLLSTVGSGGMGTVWRAEDQLLGRMVAVKEVAPPTDVTADEGRTLRDRTLAEARIAARLAHPNVVTVYDVVEDGGRPWIVMELVDARSLRDIVDQAGPLTPHQTAQIGNQLLSALRAAHALGIVHRDVKPGNVLIDGDGRAVLADFGIARTLDSPTVTRSGVIVGSPAYTAPERARGERGGPASDLWALGATLYATVEGRPPYQRDGALATLNAVATEEPDLPTLAGPLWPVLRGLLTGDPERRLSPETAERLLRAVAGTADSEATIPLARRLTVGLGDAALTADAASAQLAQAERTRAFRGAGGGRDAAATGSGGRLPAMPDRSQEYRAIAEADDRPYRETKRRWPALLAMVAVVVVMLAGGLIALKTVAGPGSGDSGQQRHPGRAVSRGQARSPRQSASQPSPSGSRGRSSPSDSPGSGNPTSQAPIRVPTGYHLYRDTTGFSIGVPDGWAVSHKGHYVYVEPPDGTMYLLIDQTTHPKPDPLADWRQQEAARRSTFPDYHLIRLEAVNYPQAQKAADWEFTYTSSSGPRHVLNRNVLANSRHAYALYWSVPADQWDASYHFFRTLARTFRPAST